MIPPPIVLCFSGHDPMGGAGLHADIEAIAAQGAHAFTLATAWTVQDTTNVRRVMPTAPATLAEQVALIEEDATVSAIKIGLLGDPAQVPVIAGAIDRLRVPVVFDPVLRAGGGANLVGSALQAAVIEQLLPRVTVLTPNAAEARRLAPGLETLDACGGRLRAAGCAHVLITGGDESGPTVVNRWYGPEGSPVRFEWPRLPQTFHGAGCTLASAIAARLALGEPMRVALEQAQRWTQGTLAQAVAVGRGRRIPFRR